MFTFYIVEKNYQLNVQRTCLNTYNIGSINSNELYTTENMTIINYINKHHDHDQFKMIVSYTSQYLGTFAIKDRQTMCELSLKRLL